MVNQSGMAVSPEEVRAITWHHSIDLGGGIVTPGARSSESLLNGLANLHIPDLAGKSVLDIGAWDGYFSFVAERSGAARVVALDHFVWMLDMPAFGRYEQECRAKGEAPKSAEDIPELWHPVELPGKAGIDLARRVLHSKVETVVGDIMTIDLAQLGTFDVVLFLGVLYHLRDPFAALRRLREITKEVCVIESACVTVPGAEHHQLWEFFATDELDADPTNWWTPNVTALEAMCLAAGFSGVETVTRPAPDSQPAAGYDFHYGRVVVHAHV
jgi:tRNA (mo5U34)-methyltransferase